MKAIGYKQAGPITAPDALIEFEAETPKLGPCDLLVEVRGSLKLIDITRAEEGCINYDLHQDNENPAHFLFYENWKSRELWQSIWTISI